ncbi:DMT family transporter [Flavobacterium sp. FlaQc-28]|uniref:DMT family transporter n=1 Tax=Flavobacterium sp. FlaQc-28 TaxID=3374178 RepID=UPI003756D04E
MTKKLLPILSIVSACVLWGLAIVLTKQTTEQLKFPHIALYRFLIASLFLILFTFKKKVTFPGPADLNFFLLTAFLTVPCTFLLQFAGISITSGTNASLIIGMTPTIFIMVSYIAFRKRENKAVMLSVLLSVIGIALVVGSPTAGNSWIGNLLIITSLITLSISTILTQKIMKTYSPLITTILTFWLGTIILIPLVVIFYGMPPTDLDAAVWASLIVQGVLCTSCAYLLWNYGLQKISMAKAGVYANIEPIAGVIFSSLLLSDKINIQMAVGGTIVIIAALLISIIDLYKFKTAK